VLHPELGDNSRLPQDHRHRRGRRGFRQGPTLVIEETFDFGRHTARQPGAAAPLLATYDKGTGKG